MSQQLQKLVESKLAEWSARARDHRKTYEAYLTACDQLVFERDKKHLTEYQKDTIATLLNNAVDNHAKMSKGRLFETTYPTDINFLGIQLPVIAALIPSLALNHLAVTQALDRRTGAIAYMNVKYGTNKGTVTSGNRMNDPRTGHDRTVGGRLYASSRIYKETAKTSAPANVTVTNAGTTSGIIQLDFVPAIAGSIVVFGYDAGGNQISLYDGGDGFMYTAVNKGGTKSSAISYTAGTVAVSTVLAGCVEGSQVYVNYRYDMAKATSGTAEVNFEIQNESIEAENFQLRSLYDVSAAIDLEKALGLVFNDEMVKFVGSEIKFEIDHRGIDLIVQAAINGADDYVTSGGSTTLVHTDPAEAIGAWDGRPQNSQEWALKKWEFVDRLEKGNLNIVTKTLRAQATYLVVSPTVARLVKQLKGDTIFGYDGFKADNVGSKVPSGPHKIGAINGLDVIMDPFLVSPYYPDGVYAMGFQGDSPLYGSFGYFPYIPMFKTPDLVTSDLKSQTGFLSAAGFKVLNAGMLTSGTVSHMPND